MPACRRAVPPAERTERLLAACEAQIARGESGAALVALSEAWRDPSYGPGRRAIFQRLLAGRIAANQSRVAVADYRTAVVGQPEWAMVGLDAVERAIAARREPPTFAEWCEGLLSDALSLRAQRRVWGSVLEAYRRDGRAEPLTELLGSRLGRLSPPLARRLADESLDGMLRANQFDLLATVLGGMAELGARDPDLGATVAAYRVRLVAARASPDEAVACFANELPRLRGRSAEAYSVVASGLRQTSATSLMERLALHAVSNVPPAQAVFRAAASDLVRLAVDGRRYEAVTPTLELLKRRGMAANDLAWQLSGALYPAMEHGSAAVRKDLLAFAEGLYASATEPSARVSVARLLLDGCFIAEDYDRALRLLEGGVTLQQEGWRAMTVVKVRAHRALARGESREAIGLFREFMAQVAQDEEFTDPVSGARVSGRLIHGINAARIGGLWASLGETAKSADAYREAKANYGLALSQVAKGSVDERQIAEALKRLPPEADAPAP
jgi:hypothetical protein